jgi:hypothetical protein
VTAALLAADRRAALRARARAARIERLLRGGLTGGDVRDGQITGALLRPGLAVTPAAGAAAITGLAAAAPRALRGLPAVSVGAVPRSARALLTNRRISVEALRRATMLRDRLAGGIGSPEIRDGSLGAPDIARNS